MRFCLSLLVATVLLSIAGAAQKPADAAGNWRVEFVTPAQGEVGVNMTIIQREGKITGHVINEDGEYPVQGTIVGDRISVDWTVPDEGKPMKITMIGTVEGEYITGVARLGNVGEGSLQARRVSRNPD
jgi:hypothetical protein